MAGPFPGVDPYLESQYFWPDFHHRFMNYWCEVIADRLPDHYDARLEEWVELVESTEEKRGRRESDLAVSRQNPPLGSPSPVEGAGGVLMVEPVIMLHPAYEEIRDIQIRIIHRPGRDLVALLELLSPTNKIGDGYDKYRAKRNEIFCEQKVHLVELDLLVGGKRLPMRDPLPTGDFFALVSRGNQRPQAEVYAWTVRQPLPTIPIPLKAPDPDLLIDLSSIYATVYQRGRYPHIIDYNAPLNVPLPPEELAWAEQIARSRSQAS